jgi:hypothetical protein
MSIESAIQRVAAIETALANPALLIKSSIPAASSSSTLTRTGGTQAPSDSSSFAQALQEASAPAGTASPYQTAAAAGASTDANTGQQIVSIAETQVGQTEQPPGSNESPAIAGYRTATVGAIPGAPWCAYFASWVARQAGEPLGSQGQGLGAVSEIWSWAQSTGRAIPNGPGVVPQPGDLIVFGDEHVGIVRRVLPDGNIETIEGNYENKVAFNVRTPSEPTGYVNMS